MNKKQILATAMLFLLSAVTAFYWFGARFNDRAIDPSDEFMPNLIGMRVTPTPQSTPAVVVPDPPTAKTLPGGTQTFQTFNNCGPASLSMALSHYGISVSQQTLGQALRPYQNPRGDNDDKSVTLLELAEKAKEYGFTVYHRPGGDVELLQKFISQDMPVITRTWLKPGEDIGHYRVVKGYDQTTRVLIQDDSLQGKDLSYSYGEFLKLWKAFNYEFLVLVPEDKIEIAESILGERVDVVKAWEQALSEAEQELVAEPDSVYAEFNKSVALYHLGRYQESVASFERAQSKLPPRMLWYQVEPILAYYQIGDLDTVLTMSNAILNNQNRAYSELYYILGLVYQRQAVDGLETASLSEAALVKATTYNASNYWRANVESIGE